MKLRFTAGVGEGERDSRCRAAEYRLQGEAAQQGQATHKEAQQQDGRHMDKREGGCQKYRHACYRGGTADMPHMSSELTYIEVPCQEQRSYIIAHAAFSAQQTCAHIT